MLKRFPGCRVTGLEVDGIQHQKNLENPQQGLTFLAAGAQEIPFPDATFDLAIMLKSLASHSGGTHEPGTRGDCARGAPGWQVVRFGRLTPARSTPSPASTTKSASCGLKRSGRLDAAIAAGKWVQSNEIRFDSVSYFKNFEDYEKKQMHATFRESTVTPEIMDRVRKAFEPPRGPDGVTFRRPQHARLLQRI